MEIRIPYIQYTICVCDVYCVYEYKEEYNFNGQSVSSQIGLLIGLTIWDEAKAIQFWFDLIRFKFNIRKKNCGLICTLRIYLYIYCVWEYSVCVCHNCHTLSKSLMSAVPNSLSYITVCFNEFSVFAGRLIPLFHSASFTDMKMCWAWQRSTYCNAYDDNDDVQLCMHAHCTLHVWCIWCVTSIGEQDKDLT